MPTYAKFYKLLDNYENETGKEEVVTREEHRENWDFLRACMDTPVMQYVHKWLAHHGAVDRDEAGFLKELHSLWFRLYRRETWKDSSGFEHVFQGEIRDGVVTGFHAWITLFIQEVRGNLDYRGYIKPRRRRGGPRPEVPDEDDQVLTLQFAWEGAIKPVSTCFIGVSPEFELGLYSLLFLGQKSDEVFCELGEYDVNIKVHRIRLRGDETVGSCFPEALS